MSAANCFRVPALGFGATISARGRLFRSVFMLLHSAPYKPLENPTQFRVPEFEFRAMFHFFASWFSILS